MIRLETDATDIVLGQLVREYARQHYDVGAATKAESLENGGSVVKLADSWSMSALDGLRRVLVAAGYRVFMELRPGPL